MKRSARTRQEYLSAEGVLLIVREVCAPPPLAPGQPPIVPGDPAEGVEILLAVWDDGHATALHGRVDLGTGVRTAFGQIAAEELDLRLDQVEVVLGHTASVPNQGPTIASASIQVHALPLQRAAAQARAWLVAQAAAALWVPADRLAVEGGVVRDGASGRSITYAELLAGRRECLMLADDVPLKNPRDYRVIGQESPRVDIPGKAAGEVSFVHDMRMPGMLHGRVIRPPYAGLDAGDFVGRTLESVDEGSIAHLPGIVRVVVQGDFVGVVAQREEQAEAAMRELRVLWKPWPGMPALGDIEHALRTNPSTQRIVAEHGDVDAAIAAAAQPMPRTYLWPYQLHASIGPSCAVADYRAGEGEAPSVTVWAGTQSPHVLRADIARLLGLPDTAVDVVRMEAAGCYGRNGADDVAADAALLSRAVGAPVRVQLTREQENLWEPKGAAQLMEIDGGLTAEGAIAGYDFRTSYPSNAAPTLALLLTRTIEPVAQAFEMGDRTSVPPYEIPNLRVTIKDMAPILRASWLRGVSALPNAFAHESYIDELATAAGADPVAYRLQHLKDQRAAELVRATAERAGWLVHTAPQRQPAEGDILKGQGFAYARYVHSKFPGFGAAWAAWVADVEVNRVTGDVHVSRVVVGHDAGQMINPAGVRHQIHGNVIQTTSRALKEQVQLDPATHAVTSREWGSYPILSFREVPVIEVMTMPRPGEPPLGVGESSSVPGTAAIANAIFDATGVRFRSPPFTPNVVRAALNPAGLPAPAPVAPWPAQAVPEDAPWPVRRKGVLATAAALVGGLLAVAGAAVGWRPAIAPVIAPSAGLYADGVIERGRQLAAIGDCVVCHTAPGGVPNAGGRAMETPFGIVYSTNLTPDPETGIGRWSFSAFQRAMREGISRDGSHLYPAFPYTAFTKIGDGELTALYTYLMSQPAVAAVPPRTALAFPFSVRPLMAMWNAVYLAPGPVAPLASRDAVWNRGEALVNGIGHCGACHTARNAWGAERGGPAHLGGAMVDGWEAPPLTAATHAPVPWTESELYRYLRTGHTLQHGVAAGPMGPVVQQLGGVPEEDVRAMARYLASFQPAAIDDAAAASLAAEVRARASAQAAVLRGPGERLFNGACGACHHDGDGPSLLGKNLSLALNSNLHSERPDNLLRVILDGIQQPATSEHGFMPGFRGSLDDRQIAELAAYVRQRFAPGRPPWVDIEVTSARLGVASSQK